MRIRRSGRGSHSIAVDERSSAAPEFSLPLDATEHPDLHRLRFPYPYRAALAISSDCDGMRLETFERIHSFFNTESETPLGTGVGLDIADSLWVYAPRTGRNALGARLLSLKNGLDASADEALAPALAHYVHCGWIDTLHSL